MEGVGQMDRPKYNALAPAGIKGGGVRGHKMVQ